MKSNRPLSFAAPFRRFTVREALVELGEMDTPWTEEAFVGYVQDPTGWLRETLDNRRARGKMAYQVREEAQAYDLYAYLSTFGADDMEDSDGDS